MKANRDDMSEYLRPEKKKGHWPLLIVIGGVLSLGSSNDIRKAYCN